MNPEEKIEGLRRLLGDEFSREELETILAESPELAESSWAGGLEALRRSPVPALRADFTARVMARLEKPGAWRRFRLRWLNLPRLALASALAAGLVAVLWIGLPGEGPVGPPLSVREAVGAQGERVYFVRFALRRPEAKQVAVAGDFNQWSAVALSPSADGVFSVEVPLAQGSYGYAFVVDGKTWLPDPAADRWVEDGFGKRNSVINL